jgi:hypothetical protein
MKNQFDYFHSAITLTQKLVTGLSRKFFILVFYSIPNTCLFFAFKSRQQRLKCPSPYSTALNPTGKSTFKQYLLLLCTLPESAVKQPAQANFLSVRQCPSMY